MKNTEASSYRRLCNVTVFPLGDQRSLPIGTENAFSRNSYWCSDEQMTERKRGGEEEGEEFRGKLDREKGQERNEMHH